MKLWSFKPTEFLGVGCRVAVGLAICTYVGYFLFIEEDLNDHFKSLVRTFFKWAAVTVVVTTQPLTGRVAEICLQRVIGTVVGGYVGFLVATFGSHLNLLEDEIFMTCVSAFVGFTGCYLGWLLKLETSARLFTMTYLLVAYGVDKSSAAEEVAITRTGGIVTGVLVSMTMSVLIFPNSATDQAVEKMRTAVGQLGKLNELAWAHAELAQNPSLMEVMGGIGRSYARDALKTNSSMLKQAGKLQKDELSEPLLGEDNVLSDSKVEEGRSSQEVDLLQKAAEGVLAGIYKDLDGSEGLLAAAKQEILVPMPRGRWCFLPGTAFCLCPGQWMLPATELREVSTTLRRVARLIWTLHTTFVEGFDENMAAVLEKQYPKQLFPLLIKYSTDFVNDIVASFPYKVDVPEHNLVAFEKCVEALHCVSDYQRRRIIRALKHYKRKASIRRSTTLSGRAHQDNSGMRPSASSHSLADQCNTAGVAEAVQYVAGQCFPPSHTAPRAIVTHSRPPMTVSVASPPNQAMTMQATPGTSPTDILLRLKNMTAIDIQPPTPTYSDFNETPRSLLHYSSYSNPQMSRMFRTSFELPPGVDIQQGALFRRSISMNSDQDLTTPTHSRQLDEFDEMFESDVSGPVRVPSMVGTSKAYLPPLPPPAGMASLRARSPLPSANENQAGAAAAATDTATRAAASGNAEVASTTDTAAWADTGTAGTGTAGTGTAGTGTAGTGTAGTGTTAAGSTGSGIVSAGSEHGTAGTMNDAAAVAAASAAAAIAPAAAAAAAARAAAAANESPSSTAVEQPSHPQQTVGKSGNYVPSAFAQHLLDGYNPFSSLAGSNTSSSEVAATITSVIAADSTSHHASDSASNTHVFSHVQPNSNTASCLNPTTSPPATAHNSNSNPSCQSSSASACKVVASDLANGGIHSAEVTGSRGRHDAVSSSVEHLPAELPPIPENKSFADLTLLGASTAAIRTKPSGPKLTASASGKSVSAPTPSSNTTDSEEAVLLPSIDTTELKWKLPRVSSLEVSLNVMFPDNEEGYIAKVRWYSFQFLMEELADEFRNLHSSMMQLIPRLPHHKKKRRKQS